jgi:hypothetical protein
VLALAVATYCTGEFTVDPDVGLVTVTVARAGVASKAIDRRTHGELFTGPTFILVKGDVSLFSGAFSGRITPNAWMPAR